MSLSHSDFAQNFTNALEAHNSLLSMVRTKLQTLKTHTNYAKYAGSIDKLDPNAIDPQLPEIPDNMDVKSRLQILAVISQRHFALQKMYQQASRISIKLNSIPLHKQALTRAQELRRKAAERLENLKQKLNRLPRAPTNLPQMDEDHAEIPPNDETANAVIDNISSDNNIPSNNEEREPSQNNNQSINVVDASVQEELPPPFLPFAQDSENKGLVYKLINQQYKKAYQTKNLPSDAIFDPLSGTFLMPVDNIGQEQSIENNDEETLVDNHLRPVSPPQVIPEGINVDFRAFNGLKPIAWPKGSPQRPYYDYDKEKGEVVLRNGNNKQESIYKCHPIQGHHYKLDPQTGNMTDLDTHVAVANPKEGWSKPYKFNKKDNTMRDPDNNVLYKCHFDPSLKYQIDEYNGCVYERDEQGKPMRKNPVGSPTQRWTQEYELAESDDGQWVMKLVHAGGTKTKEKFRLPPQNSKLDYEADVETGSVYNSKQSRQLTNGETTPPIATVEEGFKPPYTFKLEKGSVNAVNVYIKHTNGQEEKVYTCYPDPDRHYAFNNRNGCVYVLDENGKFALDNEKKQILAGDPPRGERGGWKEKYVYAEDKVWHVDAKNTRTPKYGFKGIPQNEEAENTIGYKVDPQNGKMYITDRDGHPLEQTVNGSQVKIPVASIKGGYEPGYIFNKETGMVHIHNYRDGSSTPLYRVPINDQMSYKIDHQTGSLFAKGLNDPEFPEEPIATKEGYLYEGFNLNTGIEKLTVNNANRLKNMAESYFRRIDYILNQLDESKNTRTAETDIVTLRNACQTMWKDLYSFRNYLAEHPKLVTDTYRSYLQRNIDKSLFDLMNILKDDEKLGPRAKASKQFNTYSDKAEIVRAALGATLETAIKIKIKEYLQSSTLSDDNDVQQQLETPPETSNQAKVNKITEDFSDENTARVIAYPIRDEDGNSQNIVTVQQMKGNLFCANFIFEDLNFKPKRTSLDVFSSIPDDRLLNWALRNLKSLIDKSPDKTKPFVLNPTKKADGTPKLDKHKVEALVFASEYLRKVHNEPITFVNNTDFKVSVSDKQLIGFKNTLATDPKDSKGEAFYHSSDVGKAKALIGKSLVSTKEITAKALVENTTLSPANGPK